MYDSKIIFFLRMRNRIVIEESITMQPAIIKHHTVPNFIKNTV